MDSSTSREIVEYRFKPFVWTKEVPLSGVTGSDVPKPRSGHRIVFYKGFIYSFGGYNPYVALADPDLVNDPFWKESRPLFKELWKYNVHSRLWEKVIYTKKNFVPDQLASHGMVIWQDRLLLYGGTGAPFGLTTTTKVFSMDLRTNQWTILAEEVLEEDDDEEEDQDQDQDQDQGQGQVMEQGQEQEMQQDNENQQEVLPLKLISLYGQAVILHDGELYTLGGTSGFVYYMDVHKFNPISKTWDCLYRHADREEDPPTRYRHELCVYKNVIYVFGGGTSYQVNRLNTIPGFDLDSKSWIWAKTHPDVTMPIDESITEQYPEPRRCHNLLHVGKFVFLIGGYDGKNIFSNVWRLDLDSMIWTKMDQDLPETVYFQAAAAAPSGKLFVYGGVKNIENNIRSNSIHSFWGTIPSLRDMCWEAMNHYVPDLNKTPVERLLESGIPKDLVIELHGEIDG